MTDPTTTRLLAYLGICWALFLGCLVLADVEICVLPVLQSWHGQAQPEYGNHATLDHQVDNARLIAAAPALLEAAKAVEIDLAKLAWDTPINPQRLLDLRMTLTTAIALAEGGEE